MEYSLSNIWLILCIVLAGGGVLHSVWVHINDLGHIKTEINLLSDKFNDLQKKTSKQGERISKLEGIVNSRRKK